MKEENVNKKAYRQLAEYYDKLIDSIVLEKHKETIGKVEGLGGTSLERVFLDNY